MMNLTYLNKINAYFGPEKYLPKINPFYWVFFTCFTVLGETSSGIISEVLHLGYGGMSILFLIPLLITVFISLYSKTQRLPLYWSVIVLAGICGTNLSHYLSRDFFMNVMHYSQFLSYYFTSGLFLLILVIICYIWNESPKTFTIREWLNKPTEIIYWTTILMASALGTSLVDVVANNTLMCYDAGTVLFLQLLSLAIAMVYLTMVSRSLLFWIGIILTHPVGVNAGDFLSQPVWLGLGNLKATLLLMIVAIIAIIIERQIPKKPVKSFTNPNKIYPYHYF